jgi:hypothetical protein
LQDRQGDRSRQADGLFFALILSLAARCVIFPMPDDRLYLPTVIMLALMVVERWGAQFSEAKNINPLPA